MDYFNINFNRRNLKELISDSNNLNNIIEKISPGNPIKVKYSKILDKCKKQLKIKYCKSYYRNEGFYCDNNNVLTTKEIEYIEKDIIQE